MPILLDSLLIHVVPLCVCLLSLVILLMLLQMVGRKLLQMVGRKLLCGVQPCSLLMLLDSLLIRMVNPCVFLFWLVILRVDVRCFTLILVLVI